MPKTNSTKIIPDEDELREAFAFFDHTGENCIKPAQLGSILRALGKFPTESEVQTVVSKYHNEKIDFEKFKEIFALFENNGETEELRSALQMLDDQGRGQVITSRLREILTTMGDKLDQKIVDPILEELDENGVISIDKLVSLIMS